MPKKSLVLTLVAHQPYIRCPAKDEVSPEIEMLFSSISDTYIPLLNMFEKLDMDSVPFNISMVLTPTLCELLADYEVQQRYIAWLEQGIALGQAELDSLSKDNPRYALAEQCLNRIIKTKRYSVIKPSIAVFLFQSYFSSFSGNPRILRISSKNVSISSNLR